MPTHSVDSTSNPDNFRYANSSEGAGPDVRDIENEEKLIALRAALAHGLASGIYDGDPFEDALAEIDQMDAKP